MLTLVQYRGSQFSLSVQIPHEEAPAKKLRLSKPSKSAALHIDLCKATNPTDALQYLLHFARKPVEAESVEGVIRILLEHYYKVRLKPQPSPYQNHVYLVQLQLTCTPKALLMFMGMISSLRRRITL